MERLPNELLALIIDNIEHVAHLAQLRLTCKSLSAIAEPHMLTRAIDISTTEAAWSFFDYILKDTSRGQVVKHLNFGQATSETYELFKRIVRLTFNPNIETLEGWDFRDDFYIEIKDIIAASTDKYSTLKVLPHPRDWSPVYSDVTALLKDTLQDIFAGDSARNLIDISQHYRHVNSIAVSIYNDLGSFDDMMAVILRLENVNRLKIYSFKFVNVIDTHGDLQMEQLPDEQDTPVYQQHSLNTIAINTDTPETIPSILKRFVRLEEAEVQLIVHFMDKDGYNTIMDELNKVHKYVYSIDVDDVDTRIMELIRDYQIRNFMQGAHHNDPIVSHCKFTQDEDPHGFEFTSMDVTLKKNTQIH